MSRSIGRIAFLLSGSGTTFLNLLERIESGEVQGEVVVAIADRDGATGLDYARERGIPVAVVNRKAYPGLDVFSHALEEALRPYAPDLVVNGGFLSIYTVPADNLGHWVNVHPSLLPAFGGKGFYGERVHRAVLARGCRYSGCTVHFVTDEVDGGPIIEQAVVEVLPDDTVETLAARVQVAERELYPTVIQDLLLGRIRMREGRVVRDSTS